MAFVMSLEVVVVRSVDEPTILESGERAESAHLRRAKRLNKPLRQLPRCVKYSSSPLPG